MRLGTYLIIFLLYVVPILIILASQAYAFTYRSKAQEACHTITAIYPSSGSVSVNEPFQCFVQVDGAAEPPTDIVCGVSFNSGYPQNFCPSNVNFGGWDGNTASFNCQIPQNTLPTDLQTAEMVAFQYTPDCQDQTYTKAALTILPIEQPTPTPEPPFQTPDVTETEIPAFKAPPLPEIPPIAEPGDSTTYTSLTDILSPDNLGVDSDIAKAAAQCSENIPVYKQAEAVTGVPWQVLAGVHYVEASIDIACNPQRSLTSGRLIGKELETDVESAERCQQFNPDNTYEFSHYAYNPVTHKNVPVYGCRFQSLYDSALDSAYVILRSLPDGNINNFRSVVTALSSYNGGGNTNCNEQVPYAHSAACPPLYPGEDDPYALSLFDERHA